MLQRGQLVVLESTTYPGTTRERFAPLLEESGLAARARTFNIAFSPERIDPGRTDYTMCTTPKVVGGLTPDVPGAGRRALQSVCDEVVPVSTPEVAELTKLLENIFRSVNIALVNELAMLCDRMGIDIWEVVDAAATKPYGFMSLRPGPGHGRPLPAGRSRSTSSWKAREYDSPTAFIELAGEVNRRCRTSAWTRSCARSTRRARPSRARGSAILGVSYKAGVGDMRESPSVKIMRQLADRGAELTYHDPYVPELPSFGLRNKSLDKVLAADVVVIVTAHPELDFDDVLAKAPLVVDFRGVTSGRNVGRVVRL